MPRGAALPTGSRGSCLASVVIGCGLFVFPAAAFDGPPDPASSPSPQGPTTLDQAHVEREKVRVVLVPAVVVDPKGRPVRGLSVEDFTLYEDDTPKTIEYFATEAELPISIAFVLDVSGSMELRGRLDDSKAIIRTFVGDLASRDRAGLICFADEQVAWVTEMTEDREMFLRRLDVQEGRGPTAIYDALAASPAMMGGGRHERKAIVLLSDGLDNASHLSQLEAVWLARRAQVPIYTINFIQIDESRLTKPARQNLRLLERFSTETGGASFAVRDDRDLNKAVSEIRAELNFQYLIGYRASEDRLDGSFRRIRVEASRRGVEVRTRSGYYAEP